MRALLLFCIVPALLCAQDYFEAFGQTQPFTLAFGQKSGWDAGIDVENARLSLPLTPEMSVYPNPATNDLRICVHGNKGIALVAIYDVAGKKVQVIDFTRATEVLLTQALPNGIYFARLTISGRVVQTTHFLVVR